MTGPACESYPRPILIRPTVAGRMNTILAIWWARGKLQDSAHETFLADQVSVCPNSGSLELSSLAASDVLSGMYSKRLNSIP